MKLYTVILTVIVCMLYANDSIAQKNAELKKMYFAEFYPKGKVGENPIKNNPYLEKYMSIDFYQLVMDSLFEEYIDYIRASAQAPLWDRRIRLVPDTTFPEYIEAVADRLPSTLIKNRDDFRKKVVKVAEKIGFPIDSIVGLTIHDLIFLCGKITTEVMKYDSTYALSWGGFEGKYVEDIFAQGKGVCSHFSIINAAAFNVLKDINLHTSFAYMHTLGLFDHAINEVMYVVDSAGKQKMVVTYVDPTNLFSLESAPDIVELKNQMKDLKENCSMLSKIRPDAETKALLTYSRGVLMETEDSFKDSEQIIYGVVTKYEITEEYHEKMKLHLSFLATLLNNSY